MHFDVLERRELLAGAVVSLTTQPFVVGSAPKVVVTATDSVAMTQVAIDVAYDGNTAFTSPGEMNETVESVALKSGQATTITLNAFTPPYVSVYYVRARVLDAKRQLGHQQRRHHGGAQGGHLDAEPADHGER